jgi:hypothetical protein
LAENLADTQTQRMRSTLAPPRSANAGVLSSQPPHVLDELRASPHTPSGRARRSFRLKASASIPGPRVSSWTKLARPLRDARDARSAHGEAVVPRAGARTSVSRPNRSSRVGGVRRSPFAVSSSVCVACFVQCTAGVVSPRQRRTAAVGASTAYTEPSLMQAACCLARCVATERSQRDQAARDVPAVGGEASARPSSQFAPSHLDPRAAAWRATPRPPRSASRTVHAARGYTSRLDGGRMVGRWR